MATGDMDVPSVKIPVVAAASVVETVVLAVAVVAAAVAVVVTVVAAEAAVVEDKAELEATLAKGTIHAGCVRTVEHLGTAEQRSC